MLLPSCISSNRLLMSGSGMVCVIIGSISILPSMYQSTIFGTSVRPRAPPKAVPFQARPVTSWKGRVAISAPEGATPMMMDWPQPRWQARGDRVRRHDGASLGCRDGDGDRSHERLGGRSGEGGVQPRWQARGDRV